MAMLDAMNREYQSKIESAIFEAIMKASLDEETKTSAILSGEVVQACITTIAMLAGTSKATSSPTRTREFCDDLAKGLRRRIAEVQRLRDEGKLDWLTVIHADERQ